MRLAILLFMIDHLILSFGDYKSVPAHIDYVENIGDLDLRISLTAYDKKFFLDLTRNHFISDEYQEAPYLDLDEKSSEKRKNCHYKGSVHGDDTSFAAVSYCDNKLNGIFETNRTIYHLVQKFESDNINIFTTTNSLLHNIQNGRCGFEDDVLSFDHNNQTNRIKKREVENVEDKLFQIQRFVEMVIVNDLKLYEKFNRNLHFLYERNIQISNIVNALYKPFNISIILTGIVVWTDRNEIELSNNSSETLNNFLKYRRDVLMNKFPNDNAQLITAHSFENGIVGKALKQTMCTYEYSGGVNFDYHESISLIATTIAHELGHNFGMEHDHEGCKCPKNNCIMGPSSSYPHPRHWSSCSVNQLKESLQHGLDYCLMNKPRIIFRPSCGNGIIDEGEQCDCGLPGFCDNKCCNATTCRLTPNAQCAVGDCCDKNSCTIIDKRTNFVCRHPKSICDRAEICDGSSENCPADRFIKDGTVCLDGYAYCYRGNCETRESRCHLLWGNDSQVAAYRCYQSNSNANSSGNCGYDKQTKTFLKCPKEDIICGRLHCSNHNNRKMSLKYGPEGSTVISQIFESPKESITCYSAMVDLGLDDDDVGLVPNGAKCGLNSMCVHQKCVEITDECILENDVSSNEDACEPSSKRSLLLTFIYVFFFVILPLISIILFFFYYHQKIPKNWFGQKAFIARDYNNRRPKKTNHLALNHPHISVPLETELNRIAPKPVPIRPAPPPPPVLPNNQLSPPQPNIPTDGSIISRPINKKNPSPKPNISRPKRSPPKPPTMPPPSLKTKEPEDFSSKAKVKDLVVVFEKK